MTEPIGYAVLQIIPSLDGVSDAIDKQLGGKLKASGKQGGKALAKGVGEGLKDLEREVESASKAYDKLRDRAADALDKITVEEKKLAKARSGGKEDQIAAAEARLNKARRDSARYSREAEQAHGDLTSAQKRLGDGADDTGRRMGDLGASMRNMGAIAGGAAVAGIAILAAGAVKAASELYQLGVSIDDMSDNLQVKTGLSGKALDELRNSVERLGTTNVPSPLGQIGDVAAEVTRNLHLTGPEFDAVTSRLANLQRMGVDVDIRALGKAFRGFGVDAESQAPALNSLYEASTKSGLSIDDMLGAVLKAGPALREFGLGFGESAALVGAFEEAGLDSEKAMASLTKAFAYFANEGIPAEQGLQDVIARIQQLNDTEGAELANKVFGAKGGAQFFEAIRNGNLDLQSLSSSLQTTGLDINQVSDDTADWAEKWQDVKNELSVALQPVATPLFDTVNGKLDELSIWVTSNQDKVIDFFVSLGEGAISAAEVTLTALAGVVDTLHLFDTMVMKGFSWLPGYDDEAAKEFNDSLGDLSDKLNAAADSSLFDDLRGGLRDIADEAKAAAGNTDDLDVGLGKLAGKDVDINLNTNVNGKPVDIGSWWPAAMNTGGPGGSAPGSNPLDAFAPTGGGSSSGPGFTIGGPGAPQIGGPGESMPMAGESNRDFAHRARKPFFESQGLVVGDHEADQYGEHQNGALDIMVPDIATGNRVLQQVLDDPNTYGAIFNGKAYGYGQGWSPRPYTGPNPHTDHVHVWYKPGGGGGGAAPSTAVPVSNTTASPSSATGMDFTSRATGGGVTAPVNAFGPEFEAGIGTPGYDEYGKPGYFESDPKAVREVNQRIEDQNERIRESRVAVEQAVARRADLAVDADEAEIAAADEAVRKAEYDERVALRELGDLEGELSEAQKGDFTPAKEAPKSSKRGSGGDGFSVPTSLSGFGSAIGEFAGGQISSALGVFGVNDSPGWLQAASKFIGGISVSDAAGNTLFDGGNIFGGGSAAPLAASPTGAGVPPDTTVHGQGAGGAPGPTYIINARDTEDSFIKAQRIEREKAAAKLSRY